MDFATTFFVLVTVTFGVLIITFICAIKPKPEEKPKFKKGDRVRTLYNLGKYARGDKGTICDCTPMFCDIEFDRDLFGYELPARLYVRDLELIPDE